MSSTSLDVLDPDLVFDKPANFSRIVETVLVALAKATEIPFPTSVYMTQSV